MANLRELFRAQADAIVDQDVMSKAQKQAKDKAAFYYQSHRSELMSALRDYITRCEIKNISLQRLKARLRDEESRGWQKDREIEELKSQVKALTETIQRTAK